MTEQQSENRIRWKEFPTTESMHQAQKALKLQIEDVLPEYMEGDVKNTAMAFIAYMRANKMRPVWSACNSWSASYKGKKICTIRLPLDHFPYLNWVVVPHISRWNKLIDRYDLYEETIKSNGWCDIVWDHVNA